MALTVSQIAARVSQIALPFPPIAVTVPHLLGLFDTVRAIRGTTGAI